MMTKPRKLTIIDLQGWARYFVGTEKHVLRFDHKKYEDTVRMATDSDWAGSEERCSTHAGMEIHGTSLEFVGCIRSSASIDFRRIDGSARGIFKNHSYEEMGRTINIDVETDSTAALRDVFPNGRWKDQTQSHSLVVDPRRHS